MTANPPQAKVIDGKSVAQGIRTTVAAEVAEFRARHGRAPMLATILVGDDSASQIYVRNKHKACQEAGIGTQDHRLAADTSQHDLIALIDQLNADDSVSGILLQLPLPTGLDSNLLIGMIQPIKDVDGLTPTSAGLLMHGQDALVACTPSGVIALLDDLGTQLEGANAVVVGRSILVGKPLAALLTNRNATVTICHSRTVDLAATCARADILIAAVGVPRLITAEMVKPGAVVIDVGMNRSDDGLCGDVDYQSVARVASAITPVPGGVGPMTIACLLRNTLKAAIMQTNSNQEGIDGQNQAQ